MQYWPPSRDVSPPGVAAIACVKRDTDSGYSPALISFTPSLKSRSCSSSCCVSSSCTVSPATFLSSRAPNAVIRSSPLRFSFSRPTSAAASRSARSLFAISSAMSGSALAPAELWQRSEPTQQVVPWKRDRECRCSGQKQVERCWHSLAGRHLEVQFLGAIGDKFADLTSNARHRYEEFFLQQTQRGEQMAANRTAYLLSHAAAQADRSHRPECGDGSPRGDRAAAAFWRAAASLVGSAVAAALRLPMP